MSLAFLVLVVLAVAAILFLTWRPRRPSSDLDALLRRLQPIDTAVVGSEFGMDASSSMQAMLENARILIGVAEQIQVHHPEALLIAESMRQSARQIEWYIARTEAAPAWEYRRNVVALYRDLVFAIDEFCWAVVPELGAELESRLWVQSTPTL